MADDPAPKNGVARWQRIIVVVGATLAVGLTVFGILWQTFSIAQFVPAQTKINEDMKEWRAQADKERRELQLELASQKRDLNEIETQFCATDIVRNLMHANDLRMIGMLWQKTYGTDYPISNAYYPTICNRLKSAQ